jgi:phasin family protein
MTQPNEQFAAWNQAAYEAALNYARTSLASAEQLLKLNLDAARSTLEQNSKVARDMFSVSDPQQLVQMRTKLAETSMQQAASYAHSVYEILSQTQAQMTRMFEEQMSRVSQNFVAGAEQVGKTAGMGDASSTALKSTLAATTAMMENLNKATRQFAELSEASIKAATASMVKGPGKP